MVAESDIAAWESWIRWRLSSTPVYSFHADDSPPIASNEERIRGMVARDFAASHALLIELIAEMVPRSSLSRVLTLFGSDPSSAGAARHRLLARAQDVILARDGGLQPSATVGRRLTLAAAEEEAQSARTVVLFLRQVVDSAGFTALARVLQPTQLEPAGDAREEGLRSRLYLAVIDYMAFEQSVPPFPEGLVSRIR